MLGIGLGAIDVVFGHIGGVLGPRRQGCALSPDEVSYFAAGRESVASTHVPGMRPALERLFVLLHRGADRAARFFNLPADRTSEVGTHVEI